MTDLDQRSLELWQGFPRFEEFAVLTDTCVKISSLSSILFDCNTYNLQIYRNSTDCKGNYELYQRCNTSYNSSNINPTTLSQCNQIDSTTKNTNIANQQNVHDKNNHISKLTGTNGVKLEFYIIDKECQTDIYEHDSSENNTDIFAFDSFITSAVFATNYINRITDKNYVGGEDEANYSYNNFGITTGHMQLLNRSPKEHSFYCCNMDVLLSHDKYNNSERRQWNNSNGDAFLIYRQTYTYKNKDTNVTRNKHKTYIVFDNDCLSTYSFYDTDDKIELCDCVPEHYKSNYTKMMLQSCYYCHGSIKFDLSYCSGDGRLLTNDNTCQYLLNDYPEYSLSTNQVIYPQNIDVPYMMRSQLCTQLPPENPWADISPTILYLGFFWFFLGFPCCFCCTVSCFVYKMCKKLCKDQSN